MFLDRGAPAPWKNRANFERVVTAAVNADADLLAFEDDVDVASDFPAALHCARALAQPTVFWLCKPHNHPIRWAQTINLGDEAPLAGLYPVRRMNLWFGTQAIYLPRDLIRALASDVTFGVPDGKPFDRWLRDRLTRLWVAPPNPVQHRSPATLVDSTRVPRISPTSHLPRHVTDWEC